MKKIISLILFGLLFINVQALCKEPKSSVFKQDSNAQRLKANETEAKSANVSDVKSVEDFNFDDNSFTITDEQFQEAKNMVDQDSVDRSFDTKVINSSHFTVGTPSKTYNPINK